MGCNRTGYPKVRNLSSPTSCPRCLFFLFRTPVRYLLAIPCGLPIPFFGSATFSTPFASSDACLCSFLFRVFSFELSSSQPLPSVFRYPAVAQPAACWNWKFARVAPHPSGSVCNICDDRHGSMDGGMALCESTFRSGTHHVHSSLLSPLLLSDDRTDFGGTSDHLPDLYNDSSIEYSLLSTLLILFPSVFSRLGTP